MEIPQKCNECPVLLDMASTIENHNTDYDDLLNETMSDDTQLRVEIEYIASREIGTQYSNKTKQEIAKDIIGDMLVDLEEFRGDAQEQEKLMGIYAANCSGPVRMMGCLRNGNIIRSVVCGSESIDLEDAAEPTVVVRTQS